MPGGEEQAPHSSSGYFAQYLARMRMAPAPLPPVPVPHDPSRHPLPTSRNPPPSATVAPTPATATVHGTTTATNPPPPPTAMASPRRRRQRASRTALPRRTLMDALRQHPPSHGGRIHVVGREITALGPVPTSLASRTTALYLSQNALTTLAGIEQFAHARILSLTGNDLRHHTELARLGPKRLPRLEQLQLTGNPLSTYPHARLRIIARLPQLRVLDGATIKPREREIAATIAAHDLGRRRQLVANHQTIQRLQILARWLPVFGELHALVIHETTTVGDEREPRRPSGPFDRLPDAHELAAAVDVERVLRVWAASAAAAARRADGAEEPEDDEEGGETAEAAELEARLLTLVVRTRHRLEHEPRARATTLLLRLAREGPATGTHATRVPPEIRQQYATWEAAYAHVLGLQQQTIVDLRGQCETHARAMLGTIRDLLTTAPARRRWPWRQRTPSQSPRGGPRKQIANTAAAQATDEVRAPPRPLMSSLPPQIYDPRIDIEHQQPEQHEQESLSRRMLLPLSPPPPPPPPPRRRDLRAGEFGNRTLQEAVRGFRLREATTTSAMPTIPIPVASSNATRPSARTLSPSGYSRAAAAAVVTIPDDAHVEHGGGDVEVVKFNETTRAKAEDNGDDDNDDPSRTCGAHDDGGETVSVRSRHGDRSETVDSAYASSVISWSDDVSGGEGERSPFPMRVVVASAAKRHEREDPMIEEWHEPSRRLRQLHTVVEDSELAPSRGIGGETKNSPRTHTNHHRGPFFPSPRRPRELEQEREHKFIIALLESEQRELELRQQVSELRAQVLACRKSLLASDEERRELKGAIAQRVAAIAGPTIRRRAFRRWVAAHQVTVRLGELRARAARERLHDAFWAWRRSIWARHEFRRLRRRHQHHVLREHLVEWANLTRISVIAMHTQQLRESQVAQRVLAEWRLQAAVSRQIRALSRHRQRERARGLVRASFVSWQRQTQHRRQVLRLDSARRRERTLSMKRSIIGRWRIHVLVVARPLRQELVRLKERHVVRHKRKHLRAWRMLVWATRFHFQARCASVWRSWVELTHREQTEHQQALESRHHRLADHFSAWRLLTAKRVQHRRSLSWALRNSQHRKKRKLWMHWKIYSIARKRYIQGATKALRHYYVRLIRRMWTAWRLEARRNLIDVRRRRFSETRRHFDAFRQGIRLAQREKQIEKALGSLRRRCLRRTERPVFHAWVRTVVSRRRAKSTASVLQQIRDKQFMSSVWSEWKSRLLCTLRLRVEAMNDKVGSLTELQVKSEDDRLLASKETSSLQFVIETLKEENETLVREIRSQKEGHLEQQATILRLQEELNAAETSKREELQRLEDMLNTEIEHRVDANKLRDDLQLEHRTLRSELAISKTEHESALRQIALSHDDIQHLEEQLRQQRQKMESIAVQHSEEVEAQHRSLAELRSQLHKEQQEREATVRRLQEYESRIATTCSEINQHQQAHDDECAQLRSDFAFMEARWREESARTAELERLLEEKNGHIAVLTVRLSSQSNSDRERQRMDAAVQVGDAFVDLDAVIDESPNLPNADRHVAPVTSLHGASTFSVLDNATLHPTAPPTHIPQSITHETSKPPPQWKTPEPSAEERLIEERTSKIHADIRLLQERITQRLQQVPCVPQTSEIIQFHGREAGYEFFRSPTETSSDSDPAEVESVPKPIDTRSLSPTRPPDVTRAPRAPVPVRKRKVATSSGKSTRENRENNLNSGNHQLASRKTLASRAVEPYTTTRPQRRLEVVPPAKTTSRLASSTRMTRR